MIVAMLIHVIEATVFSIIGWFILMWLSTNLLGLFVRGLFTNPELDKIEQEGQDFLRKEARKSKRADSWLTFISLILLLGFFYVLFYHLNIFVAFAALLLMAGRLPDLLWEIKSGKKITMENMPKNFISYLTATMDWLSLPVLTYGIYLML